MLALILCPLNNGIARRVVLSHCCTYSFSSMTPLSFSSICVFFSPATSLLSPINHQPEMVKANTCFLWHTNTDFCLFLHQTAASCGSAANSEESAVYPVLHLQYISSQAPTISECPCDWQRRDSAAITHTLRAILFSWILAIEAVASSTMKHALSHLGANHTYS